MTRTPIVAGRFYSDSRSGLEREIKGYINPKAGKIKAIGCISPHAGYMCSGPVAGAVLSRLALRKSYIILGPNHTGSGKRFGLDPETAWHTPLGDVKLDAGLAEGILNASKLVEEDKNCHSFEHSVEVQLPFLQYLNSDFKFVPIVASNGTHREYEEIGSAIARAIQKTGSDATIIASSDMTHYEPHDAAKKRDRLAIDKILELDLEGFLNTVEKNNITMCGYIPAAIMMAAALELGAKKAELVDYKTSGDTTGDYSSVVGYAGIIIY